MTEWHTASADSFGKSLINFERSLSGLQMKGHPPI